VWRGGTLCVPVGFAAGMATVFASGFATPAADGCAAGPNLTITTMSQFFRLHPDNPQPRLIKQAAQIIKDGGVVAMPTDSSYALACHLDDKTAVERLRRIRALDERQLLSLLVRDLSELANFAMVDNRQFRLIKSVTPGPYVFVLEATKEVPRRLSHPSRKTIGLRVPDHAITLALLEELGQPLLGTTLIMPGETQPLNDAEEIRTLLEKQLDLVIDGGACPNEPSTIVDLTGAEPVLVRAGRGSLAPFGLEQQA
jgi:tRNA threonylcarbamoyl adenosine modification protein (Sua5/YciO/YrdC/YwlC family)